MRRTVLLTTAAALFLATLPGCATTDPSLGGHKGAAIGAGAGAVGGAVIGGLVGGKRGAVAGGLLGALAGGLVGNYYDQKEKSLAETRQAHADYTPAKGTRIRIEQLKAAPPAIAPGQTVDIQLTYAVLTPREDVTVPVRETRQILHNGEKVGEASVSIEREGGTWLSVVPITLPANVRSGSYRVVASVESSAGGRDVREVTFRVRQ
jgi:hypothetical protein